MSSIRRIGFAAGFVVTLAPKSQKTPYCQQTDRAGETLLQVRNLKVHFPIHKGVFQRVVGQVKAVDGVSFDIARGRTLALVGESGCGKTTVGKGILQLVPPTGGSVLYNHRELTQLKGEGIAQFAAPFPSLFSRTPMPRSTHACWWARYWRRVCVPRASVPTARCVRRKPAQLLQQVGLPPDARQRYPHEFSGGQRQRISIARALAVEPELIVCDEPTSALDVSVQAQVLNLLKRLQDELGLSYLFITHNLSVVEYLAHEVAVMYLGRIVERGPVDEVLTNPKHPYTEALLSAVPVINARDRRVIIRLQGDMPSPSNPPTGCHFHPRCPQAMAICREQYPDATPISGTHEVRCHLWMAPKSKQGKSARAVKAARKASNSRTRKQRS